VRGLINTRGGKGREDLREKGARNETGGVERRAPSSGRRGTVFEFLKRGELGVYWRSANG